MKSIGEMLSAHNDRVSFVNERVSVCKVDGDSKCQRPSVLRIEHDLLSLARSLILAIFYMFIFSLLVHFYCSLLHLTGCALACFSAASSFVHITFRIMHLAYLL